MTGPDPPPEGDEYLEAQVQRLLAEDPAIAEQGISARRHGHTLVLHGEVESGHRREQILQLVADQFPGVALQLDIAVTHTRPPEGPEELP